MKSGQIRVDFCFLLMPVTQCLKVFTQILLNSDLKASKRIENFTNYSTAPDKKCRLSLVVVIYPANAYYSDQMNKGGRFLQKLWCCVGGRV